MVQKTLRPNTVRNRSTNQQRAFRQSMIQRGIVSYMRSHPSFARHIVHNVQANFENKRTRQNNRQDEDQRMAQSQPQDRVRHTSKQKTSQTYSRKSMAGRNIPLYLAGAFANLSRSSGKPYVLAEIRKRRDVNPNAPFAGAYVSNGLARNGKTYHYQYLNVKGLNRIFSANGKSPMTSQRLKSIAQSKRPLFAKATDNLAFNANIMPNTNPKALKNREGHADLMINPVSIKKPSIPFNFEKESKLNHQAYQNRQQSRVNSVQNQQNRTKQAQNQSGNDLLAGF